MRNQIEHSLTSPLGSRFIYVCLLAGLLACTAAPRKQVIVDDGGIPNDYSQLSATRINEIRGSFVGRVFVLKEDWYEYAYIDSDPVGGFGESPPRTDLPRWLKNSEYMRRVAPAGTVARIAGTNTSLWAFISFICQTKTGEEFYIPILGRRPWTIFFGMRNKGELVQRNRFDDDLATIPWIERMLTYNTVEFVADAPETGRPTSPAVTGPARTEPAKPTVPKLNVAAVPNRLRIGDTVQLQLDFQVSGAGSQPVQVSEERTLYFNGRILPSYPKKSEAQRVSGDYKTATQQVIPNGAQPGDYEFKGEVCVLSGCISSKTTFSVLP